MTISKVSVLNYKAAGGMAKDFEKAISYLKNCVYTTSTTHINLSAVDTYLKNKI